MNHLITYLHFRRSLNVLVLLIFMLVTTPLLLYVFFKPAPNQQAQSTVNKEAPTQPQVTLLPACATSTYTANLEWTGEANEKFGFFVEVSQDPYFTKAIGNKFTQDTTTSMEGLSNGYILLPSQTYYARIFNGKNSLISKPFSVPPCP